ncbi:hypothetical protein [Microbacterium lacticum]
MREFAPGDDSLTGMGTQRTGFFDRIARLSRRDLGWLIVAITVVSVGLAIVIVWLAGASSVVYAVAGLAVGIASVLFSVFIFVWTATTTARRHHDVSNDTLRAILNHSTLGVRTESDDELDAVAAARRMGEDRDALRERLIGVWGIKVSGKSARLYFIDGPDILFVRNTRSRHVPDGGIEATRVPTAAWLKSA